MKWERTENIDNMVVFTLIASASRQHPLNRYVSKACFCSHSICLLAANSPPNVVATPFCLRFQSPYPGVGQCARRRLRSKRLSPPLILHGQCMVYRCFPSHPPVVLVRVSYGWSCRGSGDVGVFMGNAFGQREDGSSLPTTSLPTALFEVTSCEATFRGFRWFPSPYFPTPHPPSLTLNKGSRRAPATLFCQSAAK